MKLTVAFGVRSLSASRCAEKSIAFTEETLP
jgi:hypothetical protein